MDKQQLHNHILQALESLHQAAVNAATQAYDTATHEENVAENKYDTLGLEASYLAAGQGKRVNEYKNNIDQFKHFRALNFTQDMPIGVGALVWLVNDNDITQLYFLSPVSGGLQLVFQSLDIMLISPLAPLGQMLINRFVGEDISLLIDHQTTDYFIADIA